MKRCAWARGEEMTAYHDAEWGVPVHDDNVHFEFLTLEGAQAGLSWETILRKRDNYRNAFANFDIARVARFTAARVERLLRDVGIVRNRLKVTSTVENARAFLKVQREFGSFDTYVWRFDDAALLSKDLRKRGFRFVGPTICASYMHAAGLLDGHEATCFRRRR